MFTSFYQRILLLVVGLVVGAQITSFIAVLTTLDKDVKAEMRRALETGTGQLSELLEKRSRLLLNSAELLAADPALSSALASRDPQIIRSVLYNSLGRVDADLASLIALDGRLLGSTYSLNNDADVYADLLEHVSTAGIHVETLVIADRPRHIVIVPVEAALTRAWLLLGFSFDEALAHELASQIDMQLSFTGNIGGRTRYFGSTLEPEQKDALAGAMTRITESTAGQAVVLKDETFLTHTVWLDRMDYSVSAILQKSLQNAVQSYQRLRNRLIMLTSISLAVALAMAVWLAHSVTRPVQLLSAAAARIQEGNYDSRLELQRNDEFGQLADAFDRMQAGIADREERIAHQAFHDELTGLPNLRLGRDRLQQQIATAHRRYETVAVIVLGVERFKQVNETLGHAIGDRLLQEVARRVAERIRDSDTLARVAEDAFLVVAENADQVAVRSLMRDLVAQISIPVILDNAELVPSVVAGVSLFPHHGKHATELMRRAEIALTDARETMSPLQFYEFGRDENHLRQLSLVADLKRAIDDNQLILHYQPKINMRNQQVESVEALVRWIHPEHGFMPPGEFIGLAERSGNIGMLSNWVMRNVIAQVANWHSQGVMVSSAVNVSAMDLKDDTLPDRIFGILERFKLKAADLIVEVTESAMMRDAERAIRILERLRSRGIAVSIDDFGTGYSSLAKLRDLPIDELKIDRSFIVDIKPDTPDALIVKAIIDLGHSMNMKITTEGIESEAEWELLKSLGSDLVQGYYISRPLPPAEFAKWWQEHTARVTLASRCQTTGKAA